MLKNPDTLGRLHASKMRIRHQIFLILFIGLALYIARDELAPIYKKVASYLNINIKGGELSDNIIIKSDKVSSLFKSVNAPGALRVTEGLTSTNKVKLSIADIINLTNKERFSNGNHAPLKENKKLDKSAQMKVDDMFAKQYFEHVSPSGVGVSDLGDKVGYEYIIIGENLALGNFKDSQSLLDAWMASPGHRANILNDKYTEIGVAIGKGEFRGENTWIAVQHFGLPRSACPSIDDVLHGKIEVDQNKIKTMEEDLSTRHENIEKGSIYEGKTTNEQINDYNVLVEQYNKLILNLKQKISDYNAGVRSFNDCLSKNTSSH